MKHRPNTAQQHRWWQGAVFYQIYPRSFQDSNGDGIGDLAGITQRLDYLQELGVDALWLSPIFESPMYDFGYDISNYRGIDPAFGTLADFKTLLSEAAARKMRIILDGVFNHTSHQHPWFQESRGSTDNPKRDWYIWKKRRNNWLSIFGGSAWGKDSNTGEYYLHSFLKQQPDLNWRNPQVKHAVYDEIKYWLDMGVGGFRFDVINFFFKDELFRNNPFALGPTPRPYDLQKHLFDRNRPELHELLQEFRQLFDAYDAMMVGEVFSETPAGALAASYLGNNNELHLAFDFSLMYAKWSARDFQQRLSQYHGHIHPDAWPCTVLANHDQPRSLSRFGNMDQAAKAKLLALLLTTIRGTPFLYYGEEIGMVNTNIKRHQIVDPVGKRYWPFHKGRDPARTPMQWSDQKLAGFSTQTAWLPVHPDYRKTNVAAQSKDGDSLLRTYRVLIELRKKQPALCYGSFQLQPTSAAERHLLRYDRDELSIALNFSRSPETLTLPGASQIVYSTHRERGQLLEGTTLLHAYEGVIYKKLI